MAFTKSWDETNPAGSRALNLGDDDIRDLKYAMRERLAVDHRAYETEAGETNILAHNKATLVTQGSDPATVADTAIVYAKDVSAVAELHVKHESAGAIQLTSGGKLLLSSGIVASEAQGDILTRGATAWQRVAIGGANTVVMSNGTDTVFGRPAGSIIQIVNTQTGAFATGAPVIPDDDTIPEITEGVEVMTRPITPTSLTSKLKIDVVAYISQKAALANVLTAALFQDATTNALAGGRTIISTAWNYGPQPISFTHYMNAGTVAATTFRVRVGCDNGDVEFNGVGASRMMGGVMASSITITEIAV